MGLLAISPCGPFGPLMPFDPKSPGGPWKQQRCLFIHTHHTLLLKVHFIRSVRLLWVSSKYIYLSHIVHCCSASIHPPSERSVLAPVFLRAPFPNSPVCCDWSALTGLEQAPPFMFLIRFNNHGRLGAWLRAVAV